jgi:hypothetical protein
VAVALVLNATPASARIIVVDRAEAHGLFASVQAQGDVNHPKAIFVEVRSRPTRQHVSVLWNVFCDDGATSGDFQARTPIEQRELRLTDDPDSCTFAATGALLEGGRRIVVVLLARV